MSFDHVMIDLETMGTTKDAAIISIGAVRFDLKEGFLGDNFHEVVNLKSAQKAGGKIDGETVLWWLDQNEHARKILTSPNGIHIEAALKLLSDWVRKEPVVGIWGNGSDFDNVILESAYLRINWTPPWNYKMNRCYRTIAEMEPRIKRENFMIPGEIKHNSLHDAQAQARHLCAIWKLLNVKESNS